MRLSKNIKTGKKLELYLACMIIISVLLGYFCNVFLGKFQVISIVVVGIVIVAIITISYFFINVEIIKPINEIKEVLGKMAQNDYTMEITGNHSGMMEELAVSINEVRERLVSVQDAFVRVSKGDTSRLEEFKRVGKRSENCVFGNNASFA